MGPSGSGKSTLLDLLAGRKNQGAAHRLVYPVPCCRPAATVRHPSLGNSKLLGPAGGESYIGAYRSTGCSQPTSQQCQR